jgi:hypothetical protein
MVMIGFAVMTGLAAFVGVRMALRFQHGGCGRRHRFWGHRHWGDWNEMDHDGDPLDFGAHPSRWHRGGGFVMRAVTGRTRSRPSATRSTS